ncbi:hypothetical protein ACFYUY_01745 [Kitasatospora sp. NPDC004745]|uniref:hypothetical protein n=1 Tax=Kitasatospora sp. NPDC004745 TaxID=3364019 RepID=UPI0036C9DABD
MIKPSTFHLAAVCAGLICERMGWPAGNADMTPRAFNGMRAVVFDMFELAEAEGRLDAVYAGLRTHVESAETARVRETVQMLLTGQERSVLECCA